MTLHAAPRSPAEEGLSSEYTPCPVVVNDNMSWPWVSRCMLHNGALSVNDLDPQPLRAHYFIHTRRRRHEPCLCLSAPFRGGGMIVDPLRVGTCRRHSDVAMSTLDFLASGSQDRSCESHKFMIFPIFRAVHFICWCEAWAALALMAADVRPVNARVLFCRTRSELSLSAPIFAPPLRRIFKLFSATAIKHAPSGWPCICMNYDFFGFLTSYQLH